MKKNSWEVDVINELNKRGYTVCFEDDLVEVDLDSVPKGDYLDRISGRVEHVRRGLLTGSVDGEVSPAFLAALLLETEDKGEMQTYGFHFRETDKQIRLRPAKEIAVDKAKLKKAVLQRQDDAEIPRLIEDEDEA